MVATNWLIQVFDPSGNLVDIPQADIVSWTFSNALNGGSGAGGSDQIVFARPYNRIGAIGFLYQVLFWFWPAGTTRPTDPYWGGYIVDFQQLENDASGRVTAYLFGNYKLLDAAIVDIPAFNPGVGSNPTADARDLLAFLLTNYQPPAFGAATIPASMFAATAMTFDGTQLGAAVDTVVKTGRDTSGLLYTWSVITKADRSRKVVIQVDQNPNVVSGVRFKMLFRGQYRAYTIDTKYRDIVNVIAVYGGKDANGAQVYGAFQDPASVGAPNNFGAWEQKLSVPALLSNDGAKSYASVYFALHAYPQAQSAFDILEPDPGIIGGTWLQINEVPATASAAAVFKQVRTAVVTVSMTTQRVKQSVQTVAPTPYLDIAVYRMGLEVSASMMTTLRGLPVNRQLLYIRSGGYPPTATAASPARIALPPTAGVFPTGTGNTAKLVNAPALALTQLTDNSGGPNNGQTGDGSYIVWLKSDGTYVIEKRGAAYSYAATLPASGTLQPLCGVVVMTKTVAQDTVIPADMRTLHADPGMPTSALTNGPQAVTALPIVPTYPNGTGGSTFDAKITVTLTAEGTSASPWLEKLEILAAAHGAPDTSAVLIDRYDPNSSGTYAFMYGQLGAGQWDLYVRYSDGWLSSTMLLLGTTAANPLIVGTGSLAKIPSAIASSGPSLTSVALGTPVGIGGGFVSQPLTFQVAASDYGGSFGTVPNWLAGAVLLMRKPFTHETIGDPVTLQPTTSGAYSGSVSIPAGASVDIGVAYADQAGSPLSAVNWPSAWFGVSGGTIANSSMTTMPSSVATNGPTITATTISSRITTGAGLMRTITVGFTESDFSTKPAWLGLIYVVTRQAGGGSSDILTETLVAPSRSTSGTYSGITLPVVFGNAVDVGIYYTDASDTPSPITWPAAWAGQSDPSGDPLDVSNRGRFAYSAAPTAVQSAIDNTGVANPSGVDFLRAYTNKDLSAIPDSVAGTWSTTDKSAGLTLSNGNLTATRNSTGAPGFASLRSMLGKSSGKWYWEITVGTATGSSVIGIAQSTASLATYPGGDSHGWGYYTGGQKVTGASFVTYGANWTSGDVIGVALDIDNGTLAFYKNGVAQGTAYTGLSGTFFPALNGYTLNDAFTANFGAAAFTYAIPSGFLALYSTFARLPALNLDANRNVLATKSVYTGGATVDSLKPAQAGADVTGSNTAADTAKVNGVAAATVQGGAARANAVINSSNQITSSTPFNVQGSMVPIVTDINLTLTAPSGQTYVTMSTNAGAIYRADGSAVSVGAASANSPAGLDTSGGHTYYAAAYVTATSGTTGTMNFAFYATFPTIAQQQSLLADGYLVLVTPITTPRPGGGGSGSGTGKRYL